MSDALRPRAGSALRRELPHRAALPSSSSPDPRGGGQDDAAALILLSVRPTRGTVSIFGEEVSGISSEKLTLLRRRMGVVFQEFRLLDHLTTYENVALPLRVQGL